MMMVLKISICLTMILERSTLMLNLLMMIILLEQFKIQWKFLMMIKIIYCHKVVITQSNIIKAKLFHQMNKTWLGVVQSKMLIQNNSKNLLLTMIMLSMLRVLFNLMLKILAELGVTQPNRNLRG